MSELKYQIGDRVMVYAFDLLESEDWHPAVVAEIDIYPGASPYGCLVEGFDGRVIHFDEFQMKATNAENKS